MEATVVSVHPSAYIVVAFVAFGACLAVTLRNVLHAIFGLALALLGVATLFVYLESPFLAAMEVLIYVGGISVAMVFAVMLAHSLTGSPTAWKRRILALIVSAGFACAVGFVLWRAAPAPSGAQLAAVSAAVDQQHLLRGVGHALLRQYNIVFEALSVVLLLAIAGAIVIARADCAAPRDSATSDPTTPGSQQRSPGDSFDGSTATGRR